MRPRQLPTLWLMTDERVADDRLLRAVRRLPRGSGIVFRHYSLRPVERRTLFEAVKRIARRRALLLFLAGDRATAAGWGADGCHGGVGGALPLSRAVRDGAELRAAIRLGADIVFLSPLFRTRSHPGARPLGAYRFAALARRAPMPVMALGGVARWHKRLIRMLGATGFGAIDALS